MSASPVIPPGQSPPFATITNVDHRAWIIIAAALGLSITLLSSVIRVSIRLTLSQGWGSDDTSLAISTIISWVQSSLVLVACSKGLGQALHLIPLAERDGVEKMYYASNLLFIISVGFSRTSSSLFLLRVTPVKRHRQFLIGLLGLIAAWTVAALLSIAFQCDVSRPWAIIGKKCGGWFITWEVLEVFGCMFEIAVVLSALWIVWKVQTSFDKKFIIVAAFSFRLVMIIAAGFRLGSFNRAGFATNPTLLEASFICWTQAEMNYSIISATIPSATKLVKSLSTNYGVAYGVTSNNSGGYGPSSHDKRHASATMNEGIPLSSLRSVKSLGQRISGTTSGKDQFQYLTSKEDMKYSYNIGSPPKHDTDAIDRIADQSNLRSTHSASLDSDESQRMIIRKDVTYEVRRDSTPV